MINKLLMIIFDATDINQREKNEKKIENYLPAKKKSETHIKTNFEPYFGYQSLQHLILEKLSREIV